MEFVSFNSNHWTELSGLLKSYSNRSTNVYCPIVRFIPSVITNELSGMILSLLRSSVNDTIIRNYILQEIRPSNMSKDSALCPVRGSQCLTDVFGFLCKVVIMRFLSLDLFFFFVSLLLDWTLLLLFLKSYSLCLSIKGVFFTSDHNS